MISASIAATTSCSRASWQGKWRDTTIKKDLYKRVADRLAEKPGIRPEDVQIILSLNDRDDWSFGNGLASYVKD